MPFLQHSSIKSVFFTCLIVWACFSTALARPDSVSVAFADWVAPELIALAPQYPKKKLFWVVNFGTARTLPPKKIGFAAGMGGQVVFLGDPRKTSAFFTIPHAGFRLGLAKGLDAGLRLAPIPLPFASVGPGFGINLDAKYCFTPPTSKVDWGIVLGLGGAHVLIEDRNRLAYSPNVALLNSYHLGGTTVLTIMGRYVHLGIPTATGGAKANFVNIAGVSLGLKKDIRPNIALLPEVGAYWYDGKILGVAKRGPGFQYGLMLATSF
ncbi:hypothetical protein ACS5NO_23800 [Larkinella sp. GY13]|uniref:hypothetical protein n=1 Tax=Larkinella sp. GY13 TaxID=3453720 RepID=UPI003EEDCD8F